MKVTGSHKENIKCPECGKIQEAVVEYTILWNVYIHTCKYCNCVIMESEWDRVEEEEWDYVNKKT